MKTIVLAGLKGGCGKTTLSCNLAVESARRGKSVYLLDRDPSRGLTALYGLREKFVGSQDNLTLLERVGRLSDAKKQLAELGRERDYLIVDTPNAYMEIVMDALEAADCIVIPVRPSPLDILAQQDIATPITKLGKTHLSLFVLNMIDRRAKTMVSEAMKQVESILGRSNKPVWISQRVSFCRASGTGQVGAEIDKEAAKEIADLWTTIDKILKKGERRNVTVQPGQTDTRHIRRSERVGTRRSQSRPRQRPAPIAENS